MARTYKGWTRHEADNKRHWFPYYTKEGFPDIVDHMDKTFEAWGNPKHRFEVSIKIKSRLTSVGFPKLSKAIEAAEHYPIQVSS